MKSVTLTIELNENEFEQLNLQKKMHRLSSSNYIKLLIEQNHRHKYPSIFDNDVKNKTLFFADEKINQLIVWSNQNDFQNLLYLKPITMNQLTKLLDRYTSIQICNALIEMENWSKILTKQSVYLTLRNWLKTS